MTAVTIRSAATRRLSTRSFFRDVGTTEALPGSDLICRADTLQACELFGHSKTEQRLAIHGQELAQGPGVSNISLGESSARQPSVVLSRAPGGPSISWFLPDRSASRESSKHAEPLAPATAPAIQGAGTDTSVEVVTDGAHDDLAELTQPAKLLHGV